MGNYKNFLLVLILASGLIGGLYLLSDSAAGALDEAIATEATPEARSIMLACDTLAARPWNAEQQRRLEMRVEMAASQELLSAEEHLRLTAYLRSSAARSMQLAFNAWAGSGCGTPLGELEQAMQKAANWEGCNALVAPGLQMARMYREALALPEKCTAFTQGPYAPVQAGAFRGSISALAAARELAGCAAYSSALARARRTLDEFAAFDKEFREAENVYKKKPSEFSYRMLMVAFCPDNNENTGKYPHYAAQLRSYELCD